MSTIPHTPTPTPTPKKATGVLSILGSTAGGLARAPREIHSTPKHCDGIGQRDSGIRTPIIANRGSMPFSKVVSPWEI
jgi:hypothetical protein